MRWKKILRPMSQGTILPSGNKIGALPRWILLRWWGKCADKMPGKQLLPAGIIGFYRLPSGKEIGCRSQVEVFVHMILDMILERLRSRSGRPSCKIIIQEV